jgi:hypothetical protein
MADRPTSVSKDINGLHEDENSLDRADSLKDKFSPAKEQDNRKQPRPRGAERNESKMIRADALGLRPSPEGVMRRVPDRFAAARKLEQERQAMEAQNKAAEQAWRGLQDSQREGVNREQDNERETENAPMKYGNPQEKQPDGTEKEKDNRGKETPEQAWERFQNRQKEIDRDLDQGRDQQRER